MSFLKVNLMIAMIFSTMAFAESKVYLGAFDFDTECRAAANKAGYPRFQFSPLNGACYGIR